MIKNFFKQSFKNLESKKIFYKYYDECYTYSDLKEYYNKFLNFITFFKKERKKIIIISEKSFEMYACILSVILSKNIWIPININLIDDRILDLLSERAEIVTEIGEEKKSETEVIDYQREQKVFYRK